MKYIRVLILICIFISCNRQFTNKQIYEDFVFNVLPSGEYEDYTGGNQRRKIFNSKPYLLNEDSMDILYDIRRMNYELIWSSSDYSEILISVYPDKNNLKKLFLIIISNRKLSCNIFIPDIVFHDNIMEIKDEKFRKYYNCIRFIIRAEIQDNEAFTKLEIPEKLIENSPVKSLLPFVYTDIKTLIIQNEKFNFDLSEFSLDYKLKNAKIICVGVIGEDFAIKK